MNLFRIITAVFSLCAMAGVSSAQQLSSIPAAFVDVGIGAQVAGRGYAGTAMLNGANALNWNPASIYPDEGLEFSFSYVDQLESVEYGYAVLSVPLKNRRSAFALAASYSGDDVLAEESIQIGFSYRIRFAWFGIRIGYRRAVFGKNLLNAEDYVIFDASEVAEAARQHVSGTANGYSVDVGIRLNLGEDLSIGFSTRNLAAPMYWSSSSEVGSRSYQESVPMEITTGVHYQPSKKISGSLDFSPSTGEDSISKIGLGVEFSPVSIIAFRAGRMIIQDGFSNEISTFGFGIRTPRSAGMRLRSDYAFVISDLARTQQISLLIGF